VGSCHARWDASFTDFLLYGTLCASSVLRSNTNTSETSASTSVHGIDDFKVAIVGE